MGLLDLTWRPDLWWPGPKFFRKVEEELFEQLCKKRRRCAPTFLSYREKTSGGVQASPPVGRGLKFAVPNLQHTLFWSTLCISNTERCWYEKFCDRGAFFENTARAKRVWYFWKAPRSQMLTYTAEFGMIHMPFVRKVVDNPDRPDFAYYKSFPTVAFKISPNFITYHQINRNVRGWYNKQCMMRKLRTLVLKRDISAYGKWGRTSWAHFTQSSENFRQKRCIGIDIAWIHPVQIGILYS